MRSNTTEKQLGGATGKGFVKGDKRINRKGRPKSFDAARALAQSIAHEEITNSKGDTVTVTEAILRQWAASKDPRLQMYFFEVAYGKVPNEHKVSGELEQRHSGTVKQKHSIDENQAGTIFDILASVGAIKSDVGDAEAESIHSASADT